MKWLVKRKVVANVESNTYLAHHGILGMKWGVRRWQNKDGSYNASGKLRYGGAPKKNARKAPAKNASSQKKSSQIQKPKTEAQQPNQPKSVSEMTDQELRDFLNRRDVEARYLAAITPKQTEAGERSAQVYVTKFRDTLVDQLISQAAKAIAKKIVKRLIGETGDDKKKKKKDDDD